MALNRITIDQLGHFNVTGVLNYNGKLMISDHIAQEYLFEEPCRVDAYMVLVCLSGKLNYVVNLEEYEASGACLLVNMPENIIQFKSSENLEAYAVLFSPDLMEGIPYNMRQLANSYLPIQHHFSASLQRSQIEPLIPFYGLIKAFLSHIVPETDDIIRSLFQAFIYTVLSVMRQQTSLAENDLSVNRGSRQLYERFMDALARNHQKERTVQFYADKLCVTAKYLSMAIKEYSGKNPSEWICDYVIAEAKSLLRYSPMSVQEVAFHLNFPTQSAFGKFFKLKTGYSPLQYQRRVKG